MEKTIEFVVVTLLKKLGSDYDRIKPNQMVDGHKRLLQRPSAIDRLAPIFEKMSH